MNQQMGLIEDKVSKIDTIENAVVLLAAIVNHLAIKPKEEEL
jgi:hypothetical protein